MSHLVDFTCCALVFFIEYINISWITKQNANINLKNILLIVLISTINYICIFIPPAIIKMIISFISIYFISKYLVRNNEESSISISILYYSMIVIIELLFSILIVRLIKINVVRYILSNGYTKSLISILMGLILLVLSRFKIFHIIYKKITKIVNKLKIKASVISILVVIVCIIQVMYIYNIVNYNYVLSILYIILFLVLLGYFSFSVYRNYYLKALNEILKTNDEKMNQLLNEYKMYKHNTRHQLVAIASAGNKKVKKMVDSYLNEFLISTDYICNVSTMPVGIQGVIYEKLVSFNNYNIQVDNYIKNDPLDILNVNTYCKFVQSLSIMLDNALEYCSSNSISNYVYLLLNEDKNSYIIQCCNNFTNDIDITGDKATSGKKKGMGVGQNYILNKTGFNFKISINNNVYKTSITIKK